VKIQDVHLEMKEVKVYGPTTYECDLCRKPFSRSHYSQETAKIKFQTGSSFPEGGSIEKDEAYFCPSCADRVKNKLTKIGVRFTHEEIDF